MAANNPYHPPNSADSSTNPEYATYLNGNPNRSDDGISHETPSEFEPSLYNSSPDLIEIMQVVIRVGILMLQSGTVSFRVEQAMSRVAVALGADRLDAYVILSGIIASIHQGKHHYTQTARIKSIGVDMNRLSTVERLSQTIPLHTHPQTIAKELDHIEQMPRVYPYPFNIVILAIACGAFAALNGGGSIEFGAATFGAGIGQTLQAYLHRRIRLHSIAVTILCAMTATLMCQLAFVIFATIGFVPQTVQAGFLGAVIFLVPGMPLVTATLDLIRFDTISGIVRATYALMLMSGVAIGMLIAATLIGRSIF